MRLVIYVSSIDKHAVFAKDFVGSLYAFVSIVQWILDVLMITEGFVAIEDEFLLRNLCGDSIALHVDSSCGSLNVGESETMNATIALCINNQPWQSA